MRGHAAQRAAQWATPALAAVVLLAFQFSRSLHSLPQVLTSHVTKGVEAPASPWTPWLLPSNATATLPYAGLHDDLTALLAVQAKVVGNSTKAVSALLMNAAATAMAQNYIYTLVKFAGGQPCTGVASLCCGAPSRD